MPMCEKGNGMGGFGGDSGNSLPTDRSQLDHIFDERKGHLPDTPRNRQRLMELANDESCRLGKDKYGNIWYARTEQDGSQTWVSVRNGIIQEGSSNKTPRPWNAETGLNRNPKGNPRNVFRRRRN